MPRQLDDFGGRMEKFYITTAIDYVNAAPHIGHAYEKIAADILARHHRLRGHDVFFLTGVDEHGSKVEKSATEAGKTPQVFVDEISEKFREAWKALNIAPDYFIRTTEERHTKVVQEVFRRMRAKGDAYKGQYTGLYCEGCEDFLRERDLDANGNCPNHLKPPKEVKEDNYFFKLTAYKDKLRQWITSENVVLPESRRKEVLNQLDDPELGDFSISRARSSLTWGIPVPDEPEQVIYVWVDALTNYITGVGAFTDETMFQRYWPADLHLVGKDITKFHAIYWPAMLMSADIPVPKRVFGHGFITMDGQKISKSIGNVIDPNTLVDKYGVDAVRFFLMAGTPFDQDGDFSRKEMINKVNSELANNLGNLLNRTLTLLEKNCGGKVPQSTPDHTLREQANTVATIVDERMNELEFAKTIEAIFALVDQANKYINDEKPWTLFKEGKTAEGEKVLYTSLEILRRTALNLWPFTPTLSSNIWHQLGYSMPIEEVGESDGLMWELIPPGQPTRNEGPVFRRIEPEES
jgi:methionyl-tRNA synthetase